MTVESINRLKITLDNVKPRVLRRIEALPTLRSTPCISPCSGRSAGPTVIFMNFAPRTCGGLLDARKARLIDALQDFGAKTLRLSAALSKGNTFRRRQKALKFSSA